MSWGTPVGIWCISIHLQYMLSIMVISDTVYLTQFTFVIYTYMYLTLYATRTPYT